MAYFLRKLDRGKSAFYKLDWYCCCDVQGNALGALRTTDNSLSLWFLRSPDNDLDRIIAALAGTRQNKSKFDYALIPKTSLGRLDVKLVQTTGTSCDDLANQYWHYELRQMSGKRLLKLASIIQNEGRCARKQQKEVGDLIKLAINKKFISPNRIHPHLRRRLGLEV